MAEHMNVMLAADTALTSTEREVILSRFDRTQTGALVADVLAMLHDNNDSAELVQQIADRYADRVPEPGLLAVATRIANQLDYAALSMQPWETLEPLIARIRPLIGLSYEDMRDERAKRDKLEALELLGFEDADDGEAPHHIWHHAFGSIDHRAVSLGTVVQQAFNEGRMAGRNELRAELHALLKPE